MILVLGGTAEARALADALVDHGQPVLSSLAGRVSRPSLPRGQVRIGGFGGIEGLSAFLRTARITQVVDATHPFAAQISAHAAVATELVGVPLLRLARPGWAEHPLAATWTWVADVDAAVTAGAATRRPFLTTGRQTLEGFLPWVDRDVLVRVVDPPEHPLPQRWTLLTSRGPYELEGERARMAGHRADLLVSKDSGGSYTAAKLTAAAELGVPVVMISRPVGNVHVRTVATVAEALHWLDHHE